MIGASYHDDGIYVLQTYASAAGISASQLISYYQGKYGDQAITSLGQMSDGVNFDSLKSAFKKIAGSIDDPSQPAKVDLNQALLDVGGQVSFVGAAINGVEQAASEAASFSLSTLKWVSILGVVALLGYAAVEFGWVTHYASKLRKS